MDLLLHLLEVFLLGLLLLLLDGLRGDGGSVVSRLLALEAGGGIRTHGRAEPLLGGTAHCSRHGSGANVLPSVTRRWRLLLHRSAHCHLPERS